MSDAADDAQLVVDRERDDAVAAVRRAARGYHDVRDEGDCVACAEPIEFERVAAVPGAIRCIECQEAFERFQRLFPRGAR